MKRRAWVGVGSNLMPERNVPAGLEGLASEVGPLAVSPVYRCPPVGFEGEDFLNLVVAFDTELGPSELHALLHRIEIDRGRSRQAARFSPRVLDLDLLLLGDLVFRDENLVLPREEILGYAFVLRPLAELAPNLIHPVLGVAMETLWQSRAEEMRDQALRRVELPLPAGILLQAD
jgi:2-amino-4-hydroxy-6-hydroxymethyldihydropteridine diphosphokinase